MNDVVRAPFPWFGGKRRVADVVWRAFGSDVSNYVEPFFGSGAVLLGRPGGAGKIETANDRDRYVCVAPETRVLMRDLTYRTAGSLLPGDEILAFDEENPGPPPKGLRAPSQYRRWRHARILATPRIKLPCYRLTFDDGTTVVASEDHCWLAGSHTTHGGGRGWKWLRTKSLVCNRKTQRSWVMKAAPVVEPDSSWGAGWIAGLYDGEGSLVIGPGSRIILSQNVGPVMEQAKAWLRAHGFELQDLRTDRKCERVTIAGGLKETLRFLMLARPGRLIRKLHEQLEELSLYGRHHSAVGLVSKEFLGEQEVVALSTTTRTFVAEGLASHNCNFFRAVIADPWAVAEWADYPVIEADMHARHKWLVNQAEFRERMHTDPKFFDVQIAGWWVWGICMWIGAGWCVEPQNHKHPKLDGIGKGVHSDAGHAKIFAGDTRKGVHSDGVHSREKEVRARTRPKIDGKHVGMGVHSDEAHRGRRQCEADWRKRPELDGTAPGRGVHSESANPKNQIPHIAVTADGASTGRGVHSDAAVTRSGALRGRPRPNLNSGQGVHAPTLADSHLPSLGNDRGIHGVSTRPGTWLHALRALQVPDAPPCFEWFTQLMLRLRRVRFANGDWTRVMGPSVLGKGKNVGGRTPCAVFLDPPYSHEFRDAYLYSEDDASISAKVRDWALEHGNDPDLRIALCGYAGEHVMPGWTEHAWKAARGYAGEDNENREKERVWFSPHCLPIDEQPSLFDRAVSP